MNLDETLVYYCLVCSHRQMHFIVLVLCVMVCSLLCYENSHFYLHTTWQIFISLIFIDIFFWGITLTNERLCLNTPNTKLTDKENFWKSQVKQEKYIIRYVNVFITTHISEIFWVDMIFSKFSLTSNLHPNSKRI